VLLQATAETENSSFFLTQVLDLAAHANSILRFAKGPISYLSLVALCDRTEAGSLQIFPILT